MRFPVKVFHPDSKNPRTGRAVERLLTVRDENELAGLLRIGWKVKELPKTIEGEPVRVVSEELPALPAEAQK